MAGFILLLVIGGVSVYLLSDTRRNYDAEESEASGSGIQRTSDLRYFGYYYSDTVESQSKVNDHTNLTFLSPDKIQGGQKSIVDITYTDIWEYVEINGNKKYRLTQNWQAAWDDKWEELMQYEEKIQAIYLLDEPYVNTHNYSDFKTLCDYIDNFLRQRDSSIKTMSTFTASFVMKLQTNNDLLPSTLDWAGFDEYHCFTRDECFEQVSFKDKLDIMTVVQKPRGNKVFVVFNGFVWADSKDYTPSTQEQVEINDLNEKILNACLNRSDTCIGGLSFLYRTLRCPFKKEMMIAVEKMPLVNSHLTTIGKKIINREFMSGDKFLGQNIVSDAGVDVVVSGGSSSKGALIDGSLNTSWNAGGFPPQWIKINLGKKYNISAVNLNIGQNPNGVTRHKIEFSKDDVSYREAGELYSYTVNHENLFYYFVNAVEDVQWIKITTIESPSWVAWREIEVYEELTVPEADCTNKCGGSDGVGGTCPNTCGDNTPYCSSDNVTCVECLEDNHCGDSERCKDGNCLLIEEEQLRNSDDQQDEEADDDEEDEELPSQYQQSDYISVDINKDGMVNLFDYEIFVEDFRNYRENGVVAERSDLDRDGDIDLSDYALFIDMYAQSRDS